MLAIKFDADGSPPMIRTLEAHVATPPKSTSTSDNPILPKTCRTLWPEIDSLPPTFAVQVAPDNSWYAASKSVVDYLIAVAILPFALLLIGFAYALVRLSSAGPGFYNQTRLGRGGKPYKILKLRTMTYNVEKISGGPAWSQKNDTRITWVGNLLRKTHLDELPQIFNVLMGDMSLVGPRPERQYFIYQIMVSAPHYRHLHKVRPGITLKNCGISSSLTLRINLPKGVTLESCLLESMGVPFSAPTNIERNLYI